MHMVERAKNFRLSFQSFNRPKANFFLKNALTYSKKNHWKCFIYFKKALNKQRKSLKNLKKKQKKKLQRFF